MEIEDLKANMREKDEIINGEICTILISNKETHCYVIINDMQAGLPIRGRQLTLDYTFTGFRPDL